MLLFNLERYGQYFTQALMNENVVVSENISEGMSISANNICEKPQT